MQVSFTEDQQALRDSMRGFFGRHSPITSLRRAPDEVPGRPAYWSELAALDLLDVGLPAHGERGATKLIDLIPLYLEMGRALSLTPHLETAIIAVGAIADLDPSAKVLEEISAGAIVVGAIRAADGQRMLTEPSVAASVVAAGWRLAGEAALVPFAQVAAYLLVPARTPEGVCLFLVPARSPGLTLTHTPNIAHLPLFHVRFDDVIADGVARLGDPIASRRALGTVIDRATVLRCSEVSGAGERLLEMCLDYARTREQFGQPIGSYQAVQYLCTDIAIMTRVTLLLAAQAASRIDDGRIYGNELAAARRYAKQAATGIVRAAHELHAGVGFMDEHVLHLYTRRSKFWEFDLDDDGQAADSVLGRYTDSSIEVGSDES